MEKQTLGFVLSGGAARGFAHLGILQSLAERGIHPDIISGVSAGAIVGAFIASGRSPLEIFEIIHRSGFLKYTKIQLPTDGLLRLNGLEAILRKEIPVKNIEDLKLPFFVTATNLNTGRVEYFDKGPIHQIVLASSSIPVLFSPVEYNGYQYVDGGLLDNLPVEPIIGKCNKIITQNVNPVNETGHIKSLIQVATRTFDIGVHSRMEFAKRNSDLYIEPGDLDRFELLKASQADDIFKAGYDFTQSLDLTILQKK
jgi:NTE family protein